MYVHKNVILPTKRNSSLALLPRISNVARVHSYCWRPTTTATYASRLASTGLVKRVYCARDLQPSKTSFFLFYDKVRSIWN